MCEKKRCVIKKKIP